MYLIYNFLYLIYLLFQMQLEQVSYAKIIIFLLPFSLKTQPSFIATQGSPFEFLSKLNDRSSYLLSKIVGNLFLKPLLLIIIKRKTKTTLVVKNIELKIILKLFF